METLQAESQKDSFFSKNWANSYPKCHQDIHSKTYNDRNSKPKQKHQLGTVSNFTGGVWGRGGEGGGGLNRFNMAETLTISLALVHMRHLFNREFRTHQCNISENIKTNEYKYETTMKTRQQEITEMQKLKKTNSWTPVVQICEQNVEKSIFSKRMKD